MIAVGQEAGLAAGEGVGLHPGLGERDADQRTRLPLARRDEHVHLAPGRRFRDLGCDAQQVVGLFPHRRDDEYDIISPTSTTSDMIGDDAHAIGVGHRGATELLNDESHGREGYRQTPTTSPEF